MIAHFFVVKVFAPCPKHKEDPFNRFQVAPIKNNLSKWRCECKPLLFRSFADIFPNRYVAERNVAGILNSEVYIMSHYLLCYGYYPPKSQPTCWFLKHSLFNPFSRVAPY